ncbi:hypothetical protein [Pseudoduganella lutea]|uniref:hypothetical protein n=1 Tax=Pseudoduganella lutea TaxID=321985 RepID=UPI0013EE75F3|nr:hypothetical protein [Pseudoduganella lutea]
MTTRKKPSTLEGDVEAALEHLQRLIEDGWEYPDAHPKVALAYNVGADALQAAYDNL